MFYMKVHENAKGKVVAVCDRSLIGKCFEEKNACLDLKRYASFYCGDQVGTKEVISELKNFSSINLVGKGAVALAIKAKIVRKSNVIMIAGVPHVQVYKI